MKALIVDDSRTIRMMLNKPVMDGLGFVSTLRQSKRFDKVWVMMITTEPETSNIARAMDAGANAYISKPFNPEGLRGKLDFLGFERPGA
ncbi:MAG: response regulator [Polyangiaceae bacterium]